MDKLFQLVLSDSRTVYLNESQLKSICPNFEASAAVPETAAKTNSSDELLESNNTIPVLRKTQVSSPSQPQIGSSTQPVQVASPLVSGSTSLVGLGTGNLISVEARKPIKTEQNSTNLILGTEMTSEIPTGVVTNIQGNQEVVFKENLSHKGIDRGTSRSFVTTSARNGSDNREPFGSMNTEEDAEEEDLVPYITNLCIVTTDGVRRGLAFPEKIEKRKLPILISDFLDHIGFRETNEMEGFMPDTMAPFKRRVIVPKGSKENTEAAEADTSSPEEKPVYTVDEVLTVCYSCGHMLSSHEIRCPKCNEKVPGELKTTIAERFINTNGSRGGRLLRSSHQRERLDEQKKKRAQKKNQELICLSLISSDEEDESVESSSVSSSQKSISGNSIIAKEPIITEETESPFARDPLPMIGGGVVDYSNVLDSADVESAQLHCRSVRFGSYKASPIGKVKITHFGFKITVLPVNGQEDPVTVSILKHDVVKVLAHFGRHTPVMFYYTTSGAGAKIRDALKMSLKPETIYFDPTSKVEMHRRITLFPERIPTETRLFLKSIYNQQMVLDELTSEEAERILLRAKPKEMTAPPEKDNIVASAAARSMPIQRIMTYPPPPSKGGIPINTEDYACLDEDQFLNDVIIDFYLKWYVANKLKPEDQKRTYVFSSFFYKRLTTSAGKHVEDSKLSAAERRHKRVKSWTKSVDLFSKDFIIIPINESSHWFLGIICFPGLIEAVRMSDNTPVSNPSRRFSKDDQVSSKVGSSVTITMVPAEKQLAPTTITLEEEDEEKDEAEGDDDDLEPNTSDEESTLPPGYEDGELLDDITPPPPKVKPQPKLVETDQEPIKQPCILIFDSLSGALTSRSRVCATLREYLQVEYNSKNKGGKPREINKFNFRAAIPKVPQQTNFTDCGLYVLQYVEAFFQNPISDYRMPIKELKEWFFTEIVSRKRYQIQQLLHQLMSEQNVDMSAIKLPKLNLHPEGYSEEDEELDMYDEHMGEEEEDEEELGEEEEDDEDGELPPMMPPTAAIPVPVPSSVMSSPAVSFTQIPSIAVVSSTVAATVMPSPVLPPPSSPSVVTTPAIVVTSTPVAVAAVAPSAVTSTPSSTVISTDDLRATLFSRGILTKTSLSASSPTPPSPTSSTGTPSVTVSRPMPPQFTKGEVTVKRKINPVTLKDVRSPRHTPTNEVEVKKKRVE